MTFHHSSKPQQTVEGNFHSTWNYIISLYVPLGLFGAGLMVSLSNSIFKPIEFTNMKSAIIRFQRLVSGLSLPGNRVSSFLITSFAVFLLTAAASFGQSVSGTIWASPSKITLPVGQLGSTTISWTTANCTEAQVTVSNNGGPESLFGDGTFCAGALAPWIGLNRVLFKLYGDRTRTKLLDSIEVIGTNGRLTVQDDGSVRLDNLPYQGFAVNYFDGFNRVLVDGTDTSYEAGFQYLAQRGLRFVRVDFSGYRPVYTSLFFTDRAEYFRRLDAFVASAEQNGIGLIPCLFWTTYGFSDLAGEHLDQLAVTNSVTRQKMREYATAIVNRYKNSPAIWAWEFGNEWNLALDLPNATDFLPPTNALWGNPPTRDPVRDILSTDIVLPAMQEFANMVKSLDPGRPISTGQSFPRHTAWNQDQWKRGLQDISRVWTTDTYEQAREIVLRHIPAPFDLLSIHVYDLSVDIPRVLNYAQFAKDSGMALFAGEFGVNTSVSQNPKLDYNQLFAAARVAPLVALWNYDAAKVPNLNSPRIVTAPGFGNSSKVVSNGATPNSSAVATSPVFLELGSSTTGVLSFDILRAGTGTSFEGFGLGNGTSGVSFLSSGNQFHFRPRLTNGTMTKLTLVNGSSFVILQNKWYKLTASLDFTTNTITSVFVKNMTDNSAPQQLYFGAGNATFQYIIDESIWDRAQVRLGLSDKPVVYLDNLKFETQGAGGLLTQAYADTFEVNTLGNLGGQGDWDRPFDPYYASRTIRTWMLDALVQTPTFAENLESSTLGNLSGQGGWSGANPPRVLTSPNIGSPSKAISNGATQINPTIATKAVSLGLAGATTGVLSFDILRAGTATSFEGFGLGNGTNGVSFQNTGNQFYFRPTLTNGTMTKLTLVNGSSFVILQNKWYKLTASLDLTTNTITAVFVKNITDNTAPQQLYFGAGKATFQYVTDETSWTVTQVRSGRSDTPVAYLDNLKFETQRVLP